MSAICTASQQGRYDCGHIARSEDAGVKRALFLHMVIRSGGTAPINAGDGPDVTAALNLMLEGASCADVLARKRGASASTLQATGADLDRLTPNHLVLLGYVAAGWSIPDMADATDRAPETVRSMLALARKHTNTHSSAHAACVAHMAGLI